MAKLDPRVLRALQLAVKAHGQQLRKDGRTPYVVHPFGVMRKLSTHLGVTDHELLEAALLHDVLEDTDVASEKIRREFGERVLTHVLELTLPPDVHGPSVSTETKTRHLVDGLRHISWEGVLIKLCDRWDNLTDARAARWSGEKLEGFLQQTEEMLSAVKERRAHEPEPPSLSKPLERGLEGTRRALDEARAHAGSGSAG